MARFSLLIVKENVHFTDTKIDQTGPICCENAPLFERPMVPDELKVAIQRGRIRDAAAGSHFLPFDFEKRLDIAQRSNIAKLLINRTHSFISRMITVV